MSDNALIARLVGLSGSEQIEERVDGLWFTALKIDVQAVAKLMVELGYRLSTMTALPLPQGDATVVYHYCKPGSAFNLKTRTRDGKLPSIARICLAANWIEREIRDLYAVDFIGHPDMARLIRPPQLAEGFFRETEKGAGAPTQRS